MKYKYFNDKNIFDEEPSKALKFLYNTIVGRGILKILTLHIISRIVAIFLNLKISVCMIKPFKQKHNIDITKFENKKYKSFNDFFIRRLKNTNFKSEKIDFIATANSKVSCYEISEDLVINIKNSKYSVQELIKDDKIAKEYEEGICLVYRLSPAEYHRYIFCDDGTQKYIKSINGKLHTVNPIIYDKYKVFLENYREVTQLYTNNFGKIIQIEVGALCVGKIVNYDIKKINKYKEKGYFEFGGSTIIQLIKKDRIKIDNQIIENSRNKIETLVNIGEIIGRAII